VKTSNIATKMSFYFGIGTPDELAGQVQKELDILNQTDTSIMEQLSTNEPEISEEIACTCVLPSPVVSQILNKALRDGINVSIQSVSLAGYVKFYVLLIMHLGNLCNENQLDALFIINLFRQTPSTCFRHIYCPSSGDIRCICTAVGTCCMWRNWPDDVLIEPKHFASCTLMKYM
jgi:hypothetical protein